MSKVAGTEKTFSLFGTGQRLKESKVRASARFTSAV
jgi:hypothetical protein